MFRKGFTSIGEHIKKQNENSEDFLKEAIVDNPIKVLTEHN
ncbi:hypothetical protein [Bacillus niameyensis]|nr:hypothetical protein [Bacillus niameyensis]